MTLAKEIAAAFVLAVLATSTIACDDDAASPPPSATEPLLPYSNGRELIALATEPYLVIFETHRGDIDEDGLLVWQDNLTARRFDEINVDEPALGFVWVEFRSLAETSRATPDEASCWWIPPADVAVEVSAVCARDQALSGPMASEMRLARLAVVESKLPPREILGHATMCYRMRFNGVAELCLTEKNGVPMFYSGQLGEYAYELKAVSMGHPAQVAIPPNLPIDGDFRKVPLSALQLPGPIAEALSAHSAASD